MHKIQFEAHGRSMRWYEWLSVLFLLGVVCGVRADTVYKCIDAQGSIAYQGQPCPAQHAESVVTIAPAPAYSAPPQYAVEKAASVDRSQSRARSLPAARHASEFAQQTSYECRVADGEVFYRHTPCPHSVPADHTTGNGKSRNRSAGQSLTVSSRKVSREEACMQIRRPGAIGRAGRAHDEDVSTYDRNLGNDPCK
jgi:hypothetical protein